LSAANGLGMVVGPASAGLLASFGMGAPLVFIAAMPALSLLVLWRALPRNAPRSSPDGAPLRLLDPRLRQPLAVALVAMLCVHVAQTVVGFYALDRLQLAPAEAVRAAAIALGAVGAALIGAQMLMRALAWPPVRLIRWGAGVAALGFGSAAFAVSQPMLWAS
jgi:DHA1 family tetracycline resistance protein-like MFS transporter